MSHNGNILVHSNHPQCPLKCIAKKTHLPHVNHKQPTSELFSIKTILNTSKVNHEPYIGSFTYKNHISVFNLWGQRMYLVTYLRFDQIPSCEACFPRRLNQTLYSTLPLSPRFSKTDFPHERLFVFKRLLMKSLKRVSEKK